MRFLLMADTPADPDSGAAGTDMRTGEALREIGEEVDEIWADTLGRRIGHGNLHYLLELPRTYRREMLRAIARKPYDVIYVSQAHSYLAAETLHRMQSPALFLHRSHGFEPHVRRVVAAWEHRLHVPRPAIPKRWVRSALARLLDRHGKLVAKHADGHVVLCSADARFMAHMGVDPRRIAIIPPVISRGFCAAPLRPMTEERLRRIVYVGQFAFVKAPMIIAATMAALARSNPSLELTWVCGRAHHDEVRTLLGDQRDRVQLLDWMPTDRLVEIYDRHGIFLFLSFYEGFGKVVLESMCRGLCVIATRVGGAADVIADGETGLLVEPGEVESIVPLVESLRADPARAARMSELASAAARTYTRERVAQQVIEFCERLQAIRR